MPKNLRSVACLEPADDLTAETVFDAQLGEDFARRVMMRLAEEYRRQGKESAISSGSDAFELKGRRSADSYEKSAKELGLSLAGVKTLVCRMRKRFAAFLRDEVAKTVLDPADIDARDSCIVRGAGRHRRTLREMNSDPRTEFGTIRGRNAL